MSHLEKIFTSRQYMKSGDDFELFHYKDEPPLEIGFHNHDFYEIYFFISGKVTYIVEGKSYNAKPGDIFLINNREVHKPVMEYGCVYERIVIWINPDFIKRNSTAGTNLSSCFDSTLKSKQNLLRPSANMQTMIRSTVSRLEQVCTDSSDSSGSWNNGSHGSNTEFGNKGGFGIDILGNIYLIELLTYLNMAYFDSYKESIQDDIVFNRKISDIIHYINSNLAEPLSLDTLSKKFYISKYHLFREFKKYTGYTPHEYALHKRLIHSREQLKEGNRISDICQSCGFGDYSNFYRSFIKVYGMTPKEFQQSLR
ncbi:MAG TPA: AraC family transcriptional regulator [Clostridia bacterium]|nr:AraC family transcriptional regulator [Clostridia bacterium]